MPIDYATAMAFRDTGSLSRYNEQDAAFYALSIGMGADPLDERELDYVLEARGPTVVPTMAAVLTRSFSRELGLDYTKLLHGEQRVTLHRPLPPTAELTTDTHVAGILDKGPDKGAIVLFESVARIVGEDAPLFTVGRTIFARGDGGCGGPSGPSPERYVVPERVPDLQHAIATRPDQALLYRLNGDLNPLHADPAAAKRAGFPRPILHGLCSFAIAARSVMASVCEGDGSRIASFGARFTAPVFPGETIATDIWIESPDVSFRSRVAERDVVVIDGGHCTLRPA